MLYLINYSSDTLHRYQPTILSSLIALVCFRSAPFNSMKLQDLVIVIQCELVFRYYINIIFQAGFSFQRINVGVKLLFGVLWETLLVRKFLMEIHEWIPIPRPITTGIKCPGGKLRCLSAHSRIALPFLVREPWYLKLATIYCKDKKNEILMNAQRCRMF